MQIATISLYSRFCNDATQLTVGKAAMLCLRKSRQPVAEVSYCSEAITKRANSSRLAFTNYAKSRSSNKMSASNIATAEYKMQYSAAQAR